MAYSQQDVIKQFMASLDKTTLEGTAALDEAIKACSNFNGIQDAVDHMISDCRTALTLDSTGDYFLKKYCGIILNNADTGSITGKDAGGSVVKNAESIIPESGEAVYPSENTFTIRGLNVVVPDKSTLTKAEQIVVKGLYSWWIEGALKLIEESYGFSFTDSDKSNNTLYVHFSFDPNGQFLASANGHSLNINMGYYNNILEDDVNGSYGDEGFYLDRTLSHELTHSIMDIAISSFWTLPEFITEGMAELTHGSDDGRNYYIKSLAENPTDLAKALDIDNIGTGDTECYASGFMFLRYLARQAVGINEEPDLNYVELSEKNDFYSVKKDGVTIVGKGGNDVIYNNSHKTVIEYENGDGDDTLYSLDNATIKINSSTIDDIIGVDDDVVIKVGNGSINLKYENSVYFSNDVIVIDSNGNRIGGLAPVSINSSDSNIVINGGNLNDHIYTYNSSNVTINGGAGNDNILAPNENSTINGGKGNDIIYAGVSNTIIYANGDGDDTINYNENGFAKIKLTSGNIDSYYFEDLDVIFKIGEGSIRVLYGRGQSITIEDSAGKITTKTYGELPKILNSDSNKLITGTDVNDEIYNVGAYNVTITGGTGDDTIYLKNSGNSQINYSTYDGNDVIFGADNTSTLKLLNGTIDKTIINGDDFIVQVNNNFITFKEIKSNNINVVDNTGNLKTYYLGNNDVENETINIGDNSSTFYNYASNVLINGGPSNDYIYSKASNVTINSGGGDDTISSSGDNIIINGDAGNDLIEYHADESKATVNGGLGDDTIDVSSDTTIEYNVGEGNDAIFDGILKINGGQIDGFEMDEYDVILKTGNNRLRFFNKKGQQLRIVDNAGNINLHYVFGDNDNGIFLLDHNQTYQIHNLHSQSSNITTIYNYSSESKVYFNDIDNLIINNGAKSTICAGSGNDTIENFEYTYNDFISTDSTLCSPNNAFINAGDGDDSITNETKNVTIKAGHGNDTITNFGENHSSFIVYTEGDGNDVINNYSIDDTIKVESGTFTGEVDGNDVILKIGDGSIKLIDYKGNNINIIDSENNIISTIFGGKDIYNYDENVLIEGTESDDYIYNSIYVSSNVTINAGKGNDTIDSYGYGVVIIYANGDGNDIVNFYSSNDTLKFDSDYSYETSGNDIIVKVGNGSITLKEAANQRINIVDSDGNLNKEVIMNANGGISYNYDSDIIMYGSDKQDYIYNNANNVTINAGKGDDTITNYIENSNNVIVYAEDDGNDVINNYSSNDTIKIESGAFTSEIDGSDVILKVGNGSIKMVNAKGKNVNIIDSENNAISTVFGGKDIYNDKDNVLIEGTEKDDYISNINANVTINAGKGNDTIDGYGVIVYSNGDGNDIINSYSSDSNTLKFDSAYSYETSGNDIIVKIGDGSITLKEAVDKVLNIVDADGKLNKELIIDTINAYFYNYNSDIIIYGSDKQDYIYNNANNVTINAGKGDDTITNYIENSSNVIVYAEGDGNDVINNYSSNDIIKIESGTFTSEVDGSDVILKIGSGSIKILSSKEKNINIIDSDGNAISTVFGGKDIYNYYDDSITIEGTEKDDYIYNNGSNVTINAGKGNDTIGGYGYGVIVYADGDGNDIVNYYSSNDTLKFDSNYSYEVSGNDIIFKIGTGSINLKESANQMPMFNIIDADGNLNKGLIITDYGTFYNYDSDIVIYGSDQKDNIYNNADNTTIRAGKGDDFIKNNGENNVIVYTEGDGNDTIEYLNENDTLNITSDTFTTEIEENDVIFKVGSGSIRVQSAVGNILNVKDSAGNITSNVYNVQDSVPAETIPSGDDTIPAETSIPGSGNDTVPAETISSGDDTVPAETISSGDDTIPAETIPSGNDTLPAEILPAGQVYSGTKKADLLIGGDGDDTLIGGKGKDTLTGGNGKDFFIYANGDGNDIITDYTSGEDVIKLTSGSIKGSSLSGSDVVLKIGNGSIKLKDTKNKEIKIIDSANKTSTLIYGSTSKDTINGTSTADSLYGDKGNDIIKGNAGADTLVGGKGNDTLTGGNGNDIFVYTNGDGKDLITDYTTGDKIKLLSGSTNNASLSGADVVLKIGSGSIKVKNGRKKAINIVDSKNKSTTLIYGSTSKETLKGTSSADSIYGNSGNDTLVGGKGADTLTGGAGKDIFVYASGDGKDVITDYTAKQDKIKLTSGTISSSSIKGSDVVLKIGTGSITVKNGKGKSITVVDSKGKSTSKVYGTSKKNYWFTEDDNIITSEIDSIINNDSKLIGNDYNYDVNSTLTNQFHQTLATNLTKSKTK